MSFIFNKENIDLKNYNTFRIGAKARYLFEPTSSEELINNLKEIKNNNLKYFILGNGSNIIFPDNNFDGIIISTKKINVINILDDVLEVDAGVMLPYLNSYLLKMGYTNFAWAAHLPGTVGGSIFGNAEAHKVSIFDNLTSIKIIDNNEIKELNKNEIEHGYRFTNLKDEIIISAKFKLIKDDIDIVKENIVLWKNYRDNSQPIDKLSAGSTFRNPPNMAAGKLIEDAGLKGYQIGGAKISEKHANFIINENNATSHDILSLVEVIKKEVKIKYNIDLILENKVINWEKL